jgi:hypothetical protein
MTMSVAHFGGEALIMPSQKQLSLSKRFAAKALAAQIQSGKLLELGLGLALLRDGRVSVRTKALTMASAMAMMTVLVALEIPLEGLLSMALPFVGVGLDLVADGAEETVGTLLLAALILPHVAPRSVVAQIRSERDGTLPG